MTPFEYGWSPKPVECDCEFGTGQMSNYCPSGKDLCDTCVSGYHLNDDNSCVMTPVECECEFGTGQMSTSCPEGQDLCDTCDNGYHMNGIEICKLNRCTCQNGDGATGVQCPTHHEALCSSNCDIGYTNVDGLCELEKNDSVSDFSSNYFINYEEMMRFSTVDDPDIIRFETVKGPSACNSVVFNTTAVTSYKWKDVLYQHYNMIGWSCTETPSYSDRCTKPQGCPYWIGVGGWQAVGLVDQSDNHGTEISTYKDSTRKQGLYGIDLSPYPSTGVVLEMSVDWASRTLSWRSGDKVVSYTLQELNLDQCDKLYPAFVTCRYGGIVELFDFQFN